MKKQNKKAAMEMSVGTIVTIVLLMSVLVLGIFLVQRIFSSASGAIDTVDSQLTNEINQLFGKEGQNLVVYPTAREITIKKGDTKGFAFSVKNPFPELKSFTYTIASQNIVGCGALTEEQADLWIRTGDSFQLGPSATPSLAEKVLFVIPTNAPDCTITYKLEVKESQDLWADGGSIFVTIK